MEKQLLFHKPTPFFHTLPFQIPRLSLHDTFFIHIFLRLHILSSQDMAYPPVPMPKRIVRNCHRPPFLFMVYYKNTDRLIKTFSALFLAVSSRWQTFSACYYYLTQKTTDKYE